MDQGVIQGGVPARARRPRRRRRVWRRRLRLIVPVVAIAAIAIAVVLVIQALSGQSERPLVNNYVQAWSAGDYPRMYSLLDPASKAAMSEARFAAAYRRDAMTATLRGLTPERIGSRKGDFIPVQRLVATTLFGTLHETLEVPITGSGSSASVHFTGARTQRPLPNFHRKW